MAKQRKLDMDVNEFLRKVTPAAKGSRLVPYWSDVVKLRDSNCTLGQVCGFLRENGVQISIAGLSKYIKRREENEKKGGIPKTASRETKTHVRPNFESATKEAGLDAAPILDVTSTNPLKALSGSRVTGEFNPIPTAKIEFD